MSTFPETLGLGQVISRELKEEIERRYNTYVELKQQLAAMKDGQVGRSGDSTKNDHIFLQVADHGEWAGEVTWCQDRIHDEDVEYIRFDLAQQQLAEREKQIMVMINHFEVIKNTSAWEVNHRNIASKAIAEIDDLSGYILCDAEPIWVVEDVVERQLINGRPRKIWWECDSGVGTPLYKARTK